MKALILTVFHLMTAGTRALMLFICYLFFNVIYLLFIYWLLLKTAEVVGS